MFAVLDRSREYVAYCQSGRRSAAAAFLFASAASRSGCSKAGLRRRPKKRCKSMSLMQLPLNQDRYASIEKSQQHGGIRMSAVLSHQAPAQSDVGARLAFQKKLQAVTNKIHATSNIDEIMLEVSADICALFNADRLTIYSVGEDKQSIVSKVKTGLNSFKDLKLPIAEQSIAGYVALAKKTDQHQDVYDDARAASALNPQPALPAGGGQAHRLPHQADAGGADRGGRRATS